MSKKQRVINPEEKDKPILKRRLRIGLSVAFIIVVLIIIFIPKNTSHDNSARFIGPPFTKQGELTFFTRENKSIISIDIEIAEDESKRELGLMWRTTMGELEGMLFMYEEEHIATFWMKNTILALDMIFINKQGEIVTICKNTIPFSEQSYSATAPTVCVLEVNAGFTDKYGIEEGDRISWKRF